MTTEIEQLLCFSKELTTITTPTTTLKINYLMGTFQFVNTSSCPNTLTMVGEGEDDEDDEERDGGFDEDGLCGGGGRLQWAWWKKEGIEGSQTVGYNDRNKASEVFDTTSNQPPFILKFVKKRC